MIITLYCEDCEAPIEDSGKAVRWDGDALCQLCADFYIGTSPDLMMVPDPATLVADFEARMAAS